MEHTHGPLVVATLAVLGVLALSVTGVVQQATPTNNTTVQHERPGSVSQAGDAERVSEWLTD